MAQTLFRRRWSPAPENSPWYYKLWFLIPAFILGWPALPLPYPSLWPVWAVLIIRSPWHTGFITGTLSWAMLLAGGVMMVVKFREPDADIFKVAALIVPGLVITGITQAHWSRHKSEYTDGGDEQMATTAPVEGDAPREPARRRIRQRRRGRSRARGRR